MTDEVEEVDSSALWKMALIICIGVAIIVSVISFATSWHWMGNLWFNYGWPSDKGNGPEALQQTVVYFAIAAVFVPVVRNFLRRELNKAHADIHAKLDHIIKHHPDIPPFVSKGEQNG